MALKYLRDNLKSLTWILWVVVFVFIGLVFFEWGGVNRATGAATDVAATVGDEKITFGEFQRAHRNLEANYRQALGDRLDPETLRRLNLHRQALEQLINRRILLLEARRVGLQATDAEVAETILSYPVFKNESGAFIGDEEYRDFINRGLRMTVDEFEESVREDVLIDKLNTLLGKVAYVSDAELEKVYREQSERASIRYVELPASQFQDVVAEPAELESYFAENRAEYRVPEQRVIDYVLVDRLALQRQVEIPDEELRAYYDDNQDEFTREEEVRARHILLRVTPERPDEEARRQLEDVRRRIESGADFAALARELSDDEVSAERGGDLGFFGRNRMIREFEEAAFGAEPGDLVGPIKTDFGYHLIEVQERREGGLRPFEEVRQQVRRTLANQRSQEIAAAKAQDVAQRLARPAEVEQPAGEGEPADDPVRARMKRLAEEEGLTFTTSEPLGRDDVVPGLGRAPELNQTAFELEPGAVSGAIEVPRGWVVLRVAEAIEPRLPELDEVEPQVRVAVEQEKRKAAAVARLEEVRQKLDSGAGLDAIASELGVEVKESGEFGRLGAIPGLAASREVAERAMELDEGAVAGPIESGQGAVLFEVTERKRFDPAEFAEARDELRESQEQQQLNSLLASIVELRRRDLVPTYTPQVMSLIEPETAGTS